VDGHQWSLWAKENVLLMVSGLNDSVRYLAISLLK
jgi:hypothetical protein